MNEDTDLETPLTFIVCAAIRHDDGLIICGARHYDPVMTQVLFALGYSMENRPRGFTTGFIDNKGEYLTREQAWIIAERAGQIRYHGIGTPGTCYSENLY